MQKNKNKNNSLYPSDSLFSNFPNTEKGFELGSSLLTPFTHRSAEIVQFFHDQVHCLDMSGVCVGSVALSRACRGGSREDWLPFIVAAVSAGSWHLALCRGLLPLCLFYPKCICSLLGVPGTKPAGWPVGLEPQRLQISCSTYSYWSAFGEMFSRSADLTLHQTCFCLEALWPSSRSGLLHHGETGLLPGGLWNDLNFIYFFK